MSIEYVFEDDFADIQFFFLLSVGRILVLGGLTRMLSFLGHQRPRKKDKKYAESRYSKGFETMDVHTCSEIWRKDKGGRVKNLEIIGLQSQSSELSFSNALICSR